MNSKEQIKIIYVESDQWTAKRLLNDKGYKGKVACRHNGVKFTVQSNNFYVPKHEDSNESESYKASVRSICFDPAYRVNWSEITGKCVSFLLLKANILLVKIPSSNFTDI
jgi:hypothetical protein